MEAIKILQPYWEQIKRLVVHAQYCVESEIRNEACRDFWTWTVIASGILALLIIAHVARRIIREQLEFHRNKKRLEARAIVASDEEIRAATWKNDAPASGLEALPAEELAEKIRRALNKDGKPAAPT